MAGLKASKDLRDMRGNGLRLRLMTAARGSVAGPRDFEARGHVADGRVEEELDMLKLSAQAARPIGPPR